MKTKKARKQRKALSEAPWHRRRRLMSAQLDPEFRQKGEKKRKLPRSIPVRKGDLVKVMRGTYAGREGRVQSVDYSRLRITVEEIVQKNPKGEKIARYIHPSKVMIITPDEADPTRLRRYVREKGKEEEKEEEL